MSAIAEVRLYGSDQWMPSVPPTMPFGAKADSFHGIRMAQSSATRGLISELPSIVRKLGLDLGVVDWNPQSRVDVIPIGVSWMAPMGGVDWRLVVKFCGFQTVDEANTWREVNTPVFNRTIPPILRAYIRGVEELSTEPRVAVRLDADLAY